MAICLAIVGGVTTVVGALVDVDSYSIKAKDIKEISFLDDNGNVIGSTKNTEVINNSISLLLDTEALENYTYNYTIKTKVKGSTYRFNIYTTKDNYNHINIFLLMIKNLVKILINIKIMIYLVLNIKMVIIEQIIVIFLI